MKTLLSLTKSVLAALASREKGNCLYSKGSVLVLLILFFIVSVYFVQAFPFVGRADPAYYSMVAKNLVEGRGFTPGAVHPYPPPANEEWSELYILGLLHPVIIAIPFLLFGVSDVAARMPNIILFLILCFSIYLIGSRLFDRRVGYFGSLLSFIVLFTKPEVLFPWADVPFWLLVFLSVFFAALGLFRLGEKRIWEFMLSGLFAGLSMLQKPNGLMFIACMAGAMVLYGIYYVSKGGGGSAASVAKKIFLFLFVSLVIGSPYFIYQLTHTGELIPSQFVTYMSLKYKFGVPPREFANDWVLEVPPTWGNVLRVYGLFGVVKASMVEFREMVADMFHRFAIIPHFMLFGLIGYIVAYKPDQEKTGYQQFFYLSLTYFFFTFSAHAFLIYYERRWFFIFIPFVAIFVSKFFFLVLDSLRGFKGRVPVLKEILLWLFAAICLIVTLISSVKAGIEIIKDPHENFKETAEWIEANTDEVDVIMSCHSDEVNFYTGRKTVDIVGQDASRILAWARRYGVRYVHLDEGVSSLRRETLRQLFEVKEKDHFKKIYFKEGRATIYKFLD